MAGFGNIDPSLLRNSANMMRNMPGAGMVLFYYNIMSHNNLNKIKHNNHNFKSRHLRKQKLRNQPKLKNNFRK